MEKEGLHPMFIDRVIETTDRRMREAAETLNNPSVEHVRARVAGQELDGDTALPESILKNDAGTQTVLVVDDEPGLLEALCDLLRNNRYRVLAADSGEAAITACHQHDGRIDVLVADVELGSVNGFEVAANVRSAHPDVVVVLISGTAAHSERLSIANEFLEKPFANQNLLAAISRNLQPGE